MAVDYAFMDGEILMTLRHSLINHFICTAETLHICIYYIGYFWLIDLLWQITSKMYKKEDGKLRSCGKKTYNEMYIFFLTKQIVLGCMM